MEPNADLSAPQKFVFVPLQIMATFSLFVAIDIYDAHKAYGAEAYHMPQIFYEIPPPDGLAGTIANATIFTPHTDNSQQALTAPLRDVRQRFDALIQAAEKMTRNHPLEQGNAGYQLASALATSNAFFIISAPDKQPQNTQPRNFAVFTVFREDVGDFIQLADTADAVRLHHFAQTIFDEPHYIWPDLPSGPIAPLSYQWPVQGIVSFGHKPAGQEMSGYLTASFLDHSGTLHLSKEDDSLGLSFSLAQWRNMSQFQSDAMLRYDGRAYQAVLLFAHTLLPNPALWGQFYALEHAENEAPTHGLFSNFTLPE